MTQKIIIKIYNFDFHELQLAPSNKIKSIVNFKLNSKQG